MKFKVCAKNGDKSKRFHFSMPLECPHKRSSTRYVSKLDAMVSDLFDIDVGSIMVKDADGDKENVENDCVLSKALLRTCGGTTTFFVKEKEKAIKSKNRKKKNACKPKKRVVEDSDSDPSGSECSSTDSSSSDDLCGCNCGPTKSDVPSATLVCGDEGKSVRKLQLCLEVLGLLECGTYKTGCFGNSTAKAVKKFRCCYEITGSSDRTKYDGATAKVLRAVIGDLDEC